MTLLAASSWRRRTRLAVLAAGLCLVACQQSSDRAPRRRKLSGPPPASVPVSVDGQDAGVLEVPCDGTRRPLAPLLPVAARNLDDARVSAVAKGRRLGLPSADSPSHEALISCEDKAGAVEVGSYRRLEKVAADRRIPERKLGGVQSLDIYTGDFEAARGPSLMLGARPLTANDLERLPQVRWRSKRGRRGKRKNRKDTVACRLADVIALSPELATAEAIELIDGDDKAHRFDRASLDGGVVVKVGTKGFQAKQVEDGKTVRRVRNIKLIRAAQ